MAGDIKLVGKNAERAEKMLSEIASVFATDQVPYCIDGGTLLGIIRESRLLPWDNDMDMYIASSNIEKLKKSLFKLKLKGYKIRFRFAEQDIGPIKTGDLRLIKIKRRQWFFMQDPIVTDIFVKYHHNGKAHWIVGDKQKTVLKSVDEKFYQTFDRINFKDIDLPIPSLINDYLVARYGDWKTPVKEWNFLKDDKAIQNTPHNTQGASSVNN
jgi:lipopolysaccharide cholinephosphotransferase